MSAISDRRFWKHCARVTVLAAVVLGTTAFMIGRASGQKIYRWTDERGVVHFSQSPPPTGMKFQIREMPTAPPALPPTAAPETPAPVAGTPTPKLEGAARVEFVRQSARQVGPSTRLFIGQVRNAGGTPARDVIVRVTVTETQQGEQCLEAELDVTPSSLSPGETGAFEAELDNPCFLGSVSIRMEPDWR